MQRGQFIPSGPRDGSAKILFQGLDISNFVVFRPIFELKCLDGFFEAQKLIVIIENTKSLSKTL